MFGIVFGREVELDTGAFEDGFAAFFGGFVDDGGDTAVCWRLKHCQRFGFEEEQEEEEN